MPTVYRGAGFHQLGDLGHVLGVDEAGTGEDRQAAAGGVEVGRLQVHEDDRQVALEVLLLIDGEGDVAGLDRCDHVR